MDFYRLNIFPFSNNLYKDRAPGIEELLTDFRQDNGQNKDITYNKDVIVSDISQWIGIQHPVVSPGFQNWIIGISKFSFS